MKFIIIIICKNLQKKIDNFQITYKLFLNYWKKINFVYKISNVNKICFFIIVIFNVNFNYRNSVENVSIIFPKPENRTNWEETFLEAKSRLSM